MMLPASSEELKSCCARFYEEPAVRALLGDALHPGGARTTTQLGRRLGLGGGDHVLDIACGPGWSALQLQDTFGCCVTGIDYSARSAAEARRHGRGRLHVAVGDAERLPFADAQFDATIIECALCLVPRKPTAVEEMSRVLKPGGRLGIADVALERPLPAGVSEILPWAACLAGACTGDGYHRLLEDAGFVDLTVEDTSWALADLLQAVGRLVFVLEAAAGLGKVPRLPLAPAELRTWLAEAQRWLAEGWARYILLTGRRPGAQGARPGAPASSLSILQGPETDAPYAP